MSASAMIDGIITNLTSTSVLGSGGADTNYFILETTSACCAVVGWQNINYMPERFGTPMTGGITHVVMVEGYMRDENNPTDLMQQSAGFADLLVNSLISDDTLQGSIATINRISARRNPYEAVSSGGLTWLPIYVEVEGYEFSD